MARISMVLAFFVSSISATPVLADTLSDIIDSLAARTAAATKAEIQKLIGPDYVAEPETPLSPASQEALANIKPEHLRYTTFNGTFAEVRGMDRDPGTPQNAAVGSVAWAAFNYFVRPSIRLESPFSWNVNTLERYAVPTNAKMTLAADGVCTEEKLAFLKEKPKRTVCLIDSNGDGLFESVSGIVKQLPNNQLPAPLQYHIFATAMVASKYRKELLYLGRSQDTLRFAYREYQTSLIRPAFATEMTYTVEKTGPTIVRFQDTVLEVSEISNEGIRYTIRE